MTTLIFVGGRRIPGRLFLSLSTALCAAFCPLLTAPASAQLSGETITYGYDVKGRLVRVGHSSAANNGPNSAYGYDAADNRTQLIVTGTKTEKSPNPPTVAVVPLNGFWMIVLKPDI